ncbi:hypothetical protein [Nocardioides sp. Kera G14]|uniref:hypothetical protein n=1 Tax=Nocardioides sp. Kera G14 TaxID=2884264 RepID=UPI001D12D105|nr:hypothetical protein [Nocardioides sp. Kera G14]UDY23439.1 hypothetical protein LH076_15460 [Nocardioides sp. Kera G14]
MSDQSGPRNEKNDPTEEDGRDGIRADPADLDDVRPTENTKDGLVVDGIPTDPNGGTS